MEIWVIGGKRGIRDWKSSFLTRDSFCPYLYTLVHGGFGLLFKPSISGLYLGCHGPNQIGFSQDNLLKGKGLPKTLFKEWGVGNPIKVQQVLAHILGTEGFPQNLAS